MSASKRSSASRYSNSRAQSGKDAARNVGVVLGLGGLSFFLGFFVLARMVPDRQNEAGSPSTPDAQKVSPASSSQIAQAAAPSTVSEAPAATIPVKAPPAAKKPAETSDIAIEPGDESASQKPGTLDDAPAKSRAAQDEGQAAQNGTENAAKKGSEDTTALPDRETGSPEAPTVSPAPHTRTRKPRVKSGDGETAASASKSETGGFSQDDQKPSKIDRDESDTSAHPAPRATRHAASGESSDSGDEEKPKSVKPARRTRYRVVAGAYALRESAERAAQKVTDLGLEATVVPVSKEDGTTVYRVQQGIYRLRANANAAKQKLADAGLDADVVKTGG